MKMGVSAEYTRRGTEVEEEYEECMRRRERDIRERELTSAYEDRTRN